MTENDVAINIPTGKLLKVSLAAMFGTLAELFDFAIAGPIAAIAWSLVFFPSLTPAIALISSISTFAITFIARPFGAAIFGHFGDRVGRKTTLVFTLLTVGVGTVMIILDPSFDVLGVASVLILVVGRIIVGLGFGGEWGTSTTWVLENAYARRRNFWTALLTEGFPLGAMAAGIVITVILASVGFPAFVAFWWRVPFIISLAVVVIGAIVRYAFSESWIFKEIVKKKEIKRAPSLEVLRRFPKRVIRLALGSMIPQTTFYIGSTVMITYIQVTLGKSASFATSTIIFGEILAAILTMVIGLTADRIGRRNTMVLLGIILGVISVPYAYLMTTGIDANIILAQVLLFGFATGSLAGLSAYMSENFPPAFRASGSGYSYQIGIVLGVLPESYAAAYFLGYGVAAAWYMIPIMVVPIVIALIALLLSGDTRMVDLTAEEAAE